VRATKSGGAREDYNRASDLVSSLLTRWNAAEGRSDVSLAAALGSSTQAPERLAQLAAYGDDAPLQLARLEQFRAETERIVPSALVAISSADHAALGRLAVESQQRAEVALRNQIPETMFLTRAAMAAGAHASTAFGAGFGGAVWAIVDTADADAVEARWRASYEQAFPERARRAAWMRGRPVAGVAWP
jgi:galactokinase